MKKSIIAISMLFASSAMATAEINVTPLSDGSGAWIEIMEGGQPVADAIVNEDYVTNENGRVFINNLLEFPSTVDYLAVTPDGDMLETRVFLTSSDR